MAHYAAAGAHVTLVTCTLGEEGEIHVPALAQLAAAEADQLGGYRIAELRRAPVPRSASTDHRFLGGAGRYRDSGMMGLPTNDHPRAFWRADLDEAAGHLLEIMREIRPQVDVTYDAERLLRPPRPHPGPPGRDAGGRAGRRRGLRHRRRSTGRRCRRACSRPGMEAFAESSDNPFAGVESVDDFPFGTPDDEIAARIDGHRPARGEGRPRCGRTPPRSRTPPGSTSIAGNFGGEFMGVEYFTLAVGEQGAGRRPVRLGGRPLRRARHRQRRPRHGRRAGRRTVTTAAMTFEYAQSPVAAERRPVDLALRIAGGVVAVLAALVTGVLELLLAYLRSVGC